MPCPRAHSGGWQSPGGTSSASNTNDCSLYQTLKPSLPLTLAEPQTELPPEDGQYREYSHFVSLYLLFPVTRAQIKLPGNVGTYGRSHLLVQVFHVREREYKRCTETDSQWDSTSWRKEQTGRREGHWKESRGPGPVTVGGPSLFSACLCFLSFPPGTTVFCLQFCLPEGRRQSSTATTKTNKATNCTPRLDTPTCDGPMGICFQQIAGCGYSI